MFTKNTNPVVARLLDIENSETLEERKLVRADAQKAYQKSIEAAKEITLKGERAAAEILAIGEGLVEGTDIGELESKKKYLDREWREFQRLANATDVPVLKTRFLERAKSAEEQIVKIAAKIEEIQRPLREARSEAETIRTEAKQDALKVLQSAKQDPAVRMEDELVDGLRQIFLKMVDYGKPDQAVDLAAKEENMKLYQEIRTAAKLKTEKMLAARREFTDELPRKVEIPANTAALIRVRELIIAANGKGQEVARYLVDEKGRFNKQNPRRQKLWKLEGGNVIKVRKASATA